VESVATRITSFYQDGHGYQSQAGPTPLSAGSERTLILEPQAEIVVTQGTRFTHRLWVPLDVITAASPDALDKTRVDTISQASRKNDAGTLALSSTLHERHTDLTLDEGFHLEFPFRSWHAGFTVSRSLADDNATLTAGVSQIVDWFDHFDIQGHRQGRSTRTTTNGTVGLTQLLSPTTVAHVNYGLTLQLGELGNTWNSVPLDTGERGAEQFPLHRVRHALVFRLVQGLPWDGAVKCFYRFYADDWGIVAHTFELQLHQRVTKAFTLRGTYRAHTQHGASFFTTLAPPDAIFRTADSDLAPLGAQTVGLALAWDFATLGVRNVHLDAGYERYFRTNDLTIDIVTLGVGYRF
jgi:hypothetical protein